MLVFFSLFILINFFVFCLTFFVLVSVFFLSYHGHTHTLAIPVDAESLAFSTRPSSVPLTKDKKQRHATFKAKYKTKFLFVCFKWLIKCFLAAHYNKVLSLHLCFLVFCGFVFFQCASRDPNLRRVESCIVSFKIKWIFSKYFFLKSMLLTTLRWPDSDVQRAECGLRALVCRRHSCLFDYHSLVGGHQLKILPSSPQAS